jgi:2,5-diamino-6-(ribosylamino)-4(3H)-pyrimidinone 5'-phosphate reductase
MKRSADRPFVFINVAMTADGKIAPANRHFEAFGGPRDFQHLLELRATADAVMSGARTVDLDRVNLGPGPARYRRLRVQRGLAEYNLRVIVSGAGTIDPQAEIFKHRFSPIIILTTGRIAKARLARLRTLADDVKICGAKELDFSEALQWLGKKWRVRRLLCEGGGEVNGALFRAGLVDEVHITLCPILLGGRSAPTMADGVGVAKLADAARFRLASMKRIDSGMFLVYKALREHLVPVGDDVRSLKFVRKKRIN